MADLITEKDFKAVLRAVEARASDMDECRSEMGNAVNTAVEKKYLDKRAFGIFRRLKRLADQQLATTLTHLEHYCEIGGLNERVSAQGEMVGREQELSEASSTVEGEPKRKRGRPRKAETVIAAEQADATVATH